MLEALAHEGRRLSAVAELEGLLRKSSWSQYKKTKARESSGLEILHARYREHSLRWKRLDPSSPQGP